MKKISFLFLFVLLGNVYSSVFAQTGLDNDLFNLAQMKSGIKNKRISSTDPTGGIVTIWNRLNLVRKEPLLK